MNFNKEEGGPSQKKKKPTQFTINFFLKVIRKFVSGLNLFLGMFWKQVIFEQTSQSSRSFKNFLSVLNFLSLYFKRSTI